MKSLTNNSRGFTLIELMVVIAIIGILASIVLSALTRGRTTAYDAKRVGELHSILNTMIENDSSTGSPLTGTNCSSGNPVKNCSINGVSLAQFSDPSGSSATCIKNPALAGICQYTLFSPSGGALSTQNFEICAYLEAGAGGLPAGDVNISSATFSLRSGC